MIGSMNAQIYELKVPYSKTCWVPLYRDKRSPWQQAYLDQGWGLCAIHDFHVLAGENKSCVISRTIAHSGDIKKFDLHVSTPNVTPIVIKDAGVWQISFDIAKVLADNIDLFNVAIAANRINPDVVAEAIKYHLKRTGGSVGMCFDKKELNW